jgi:integrase
MAVAAAIRKVVLTDRGLKALKPAPAGTRYMVWDAMTPHLSVRVTANGAKSFVIVGRRPGRRNPHYHVLGRYPSVSLKDAREKVPGILSTLAEGRSPRQEAARLRADTFAVVVEAFIKYEKGKELRRSHETAAILRREFLGQERSNGEWANGKNGIWRDEPILNITRRRIIERLDEIAGAKGKYAARHALNAVRKLFNWAADGERFGVEVSPAARIRDTTIGITGKDLKRKRVLNDNELREVWQAAAAMGYPSGPLIQVLMLTGQRRNDIAHMKRGEIDWDGTMLVVPSERYKSEVAHEIPLTPKTIEILKALPAFKDGYLLSSSGGQRPITGMALMKARLDAIIADRRKQNGLAAMPGWVLHDLRRTVRTRLSDLGVDAFIAERVIGHALPGLHGVYDQGWHRTQKRDALARWEALLLSIVEPQASPPNVLMADQLERRRKRKRA